MTAPLPLRIDPMAGEWWRGYMRRVATTYGVTPRDLMRPTGAISNHARRDDRWSGIAATHETVDRLAAYLRLEPAEVSAMHLSAYDGSVLRFTKSDHRALDALLPSERRRLPDSRIGDLVAAQLDRWCPHCERQNPGSRAMSWRLQAHLVCRHHRVILRSGDLPGPEWPVPDEALEAQLEVLSRLGPSPEHADFFAHLHAQLARSVDPPRGVWNHALETAPERTLEAFSVAVQRVTTPGYPDYQGLATWPVPIAAGFVRSPRTPRVSSWPNVFPHLLPTELFVLGLSDLLEGAPIREARTVAAIGATLSVTDESLRDAVQLLPERRRHAATGAFVRHLVRLEQHGQAERFWQLCRRSGLALTQESVDYRARELLCHDERLHEAARTAEPAAYPRTIWTWLVDQWACTFTTSNIRPSVRDGSIEHYDRQFGAGMRAAIARFVTGAAA